MSVKGSRYFIDSSAWLAYFLTKNKEIAMAVESESTELYTSALSLFEIKRKLVKEGKNKKSIEQALDLVKNNSQVVLIDEDTAERAADVSIEYKLHAIDAIIYTSNIKSETQLLTGDNDFRQLPNVKILKV